MCLSVLISWCDTIYDLEGVSYSLGGSADVGGSLGADFLFDESYNALGFMINVGVGGAFPFDIHGGGTIGEVLTIFDDKFVDRSVKTKPKANPTQNTVYKPNNKPKNQVLPKTSNNSASFSYLVYSPQTQPFFYC